MLLSKNPTKQTNIKTEDLANVVRIIGTVRDFGDKIIGYAVVTVLDCRLQLFDIRGTLNLFHSFRFDNAKLNGAEIVNTECSMDRLMKFDTNGNITANQGYTILGEVETPANKTLYRVLGPTGVADTVSERMLLMLANTGKCNLLNAKVVNKDGKQFISGIKDKFRVIASENPKATTPPTNTKYAKSGLDIIITLGNALVASVPPENLKILSSKSLTLSLKHVLGYGSQQRFKSGMPEDSLKPVGLTLVSTIPITVPVIDTSITPKSGLNVKTDIAYRNVNPNEEFIMTYLEFMFLIIRPEYAGFCSWKGDPKGVYFAPKFPSFLTGERNIPTPSIGFTAEGTSPRDPDIMLSIAGPDGKVRSPFDTKFRSSPRGTRAVAGVHVPDYLAILKSLTNKAGVSPNTRLSNVSGLPLATLTAIVLSEMFSKA